MIIYEHNNHKLDHYSIMTSDNFHVKYVYKYMNIMNTGKSFEPTKQSLLVF